MMYIIINLANLKGKADSFVNLEMCVPHFLGLCILYRSIGDDAQCFIGDESRNECQDQELTLTSDR